jgi:hypothetical protein
MFLKRGVANVWYATLSASYLQNNEREWWGDAESLPARKTFLYVSVNGVNRVNQLSSRFCLFEYTVHHVFDPRKHFVHLSQWESSYMLTTSPKETKRTLLILKDYYSAWKGKVLLKWNLMTFLKSSNANWTWEWKYYHWFTFFYLVNTYRQVWPFLFILYRPRIYRFPATIVFFFRTPDESDESRFHCSSLTERDSKRATETANTICYDVTAYSHYSLSICNTQRMEWTHAVYFWYKF